MGWSIYLVEPVTRKAIKSPLKHQIMHQIYGSNYFGGTDGLWVNITYDYSMIYREKTNGLFLDYLDNKFAYETFDFLENLIKSFGNNASDNYCKTTEEYAKKALYQLLAFARMRPDGIWEVD